MHIQSLHTIHYSLIYKSEFENQDETINNLSRLFKILRSHKIGSWLLLALEMFFESHLTHSEPIKEINKKKKKIERKEKKDIKKTRLLLCL